MEWMRTDVLSGRVEAIDIEKVRELIALREYAKIRELMLKYPPIDIAELLEEVSRAELILIYRLLDKDTSAEVFAEMSKDACLALIEAFTDAELGEMLSELYLDDAVDIIEEMPASVVKRILDRLSPENRNIINELLKYDSDTVGSIMTPEYVSLKPGMTVGEALAHIKRVALDKETIYTCYVIDEGRRLIGIVTVRGMLVSEESVKISSIMETSVIFAYTDDDREAVAHTIERYNFTALPVVDSERRLVGIVTVDDAIDVLSDEMEEDAYKMAGATPTEGEYKKTSVFSLYRARIPWLLLLMISATLSSTILGFFESALPAVLLLFVPMLMDTGGNSGSQASISAIRAIGAGELKFKDALFVAYREARVGIMCAATVAAVAFLKVLLVDRLIMNNSEVTVLVALAVSITLSFTIFTAKLIGGMLPLLASKIGLDPAVMASPFITTTVDAVSLVIYFAIAGGVLRLGI